MKFSNNNIRGIMCVMGKLITRNRLNKIGYLWSDKNGQTAVEYVAGLLFFGVVIAFILQVFFGALSDLFFRLSDHLSRPYP